MADFKVKDGGAWKTPTSIQAKHAGVWKEVQTTYAREAGVWKEVASAGGGAFVHTITTNQEDLNLRTYALANGWDGSAIATITVDTGVEITSSATSIAALTVDGAWAGGITVVNNGTVVGRGGAGGGDGQQFLDSCSGFSMTPIQEPTAGAAGGDAIDAQTNCTIDNTSGIIGGGGGGGGSGALRRQNVGPGVCGNPQPGFAVDGGGAGGGGAGFGTKGIYNTPKPDVAAGTSAAAGSGNCGGFGDQYAGNDDAGAGTLTAGGAAGTHVPGLKDFLCGNLQSNSGGAGGALGVAGSTGLSPSGSGQGVATAGGAAGFYAHNNNATITWTALGDVRGSARTTP